MLRVLVICRVRKRRGETPALQGGWTSAGFDGRGGREGGVGFEAWGRVIYFFGGIVGGAGRHGPALFNCEDLVGRRGGDWRM